MALFNFNAAEVEPQQNNFSPLPAGIYVAQIVESEIKPTNSGSGTRLSLQFEVLDGKFTNRRVFTNINVQNSSPQAESIGQSQLSQLCHAVGVVNMRDTTQLHGIPVKIRVKIRKDATGQYGDSNDINAYEAVGQPGFMPPPTAPSPQQRAAPWASR